VAADLTGATPEKRAAVLACIGSDAYDVYRAMHFESDEESKKIDNILEGFQVFCVGAVNETYEQYHFNRCIQYVGERFDLFLDELRCLAKNCHFEGIEESMLQDRIVVGIRDVATHCKLLQVRDLTLNNAVDICKASDVPHLKCTMPQNCRLLG